MNETEYLLSTEANSEWLTDSLLQAESGELQVVALPLTSK